MPRSTDLESNQRHRIPEEMLRFNRSMVDTEEEGNDAPGKING